MLNIPYKICTLFVLLFFLINFKIGNAQILLQPEIGTIATINSGTDRIVEMIREDIEENDEEDDDTNLDESSDTSPKLSESPEPSEVSKDDKVQPVEEKAEDLEIFYPPSNVETFYPPYNSYSKKSDSENANINTTLLKNESKEQKSDSKQKNDHKFRIITSAGGSLQKIDTGNGGEIKNHIAGMDIAIIRELKNPNSKVLIGGLIDYNHNKYDNEDNGVNGSGKSNALTIGVIARHTGDNGFYYEGSARLGRAKTDFQLNNNIHDIQYEESAPVYAGHTRIGKIISLNKQNDIDIYGSYSFAHQDRINLRLPLNENYDLGSIDSSRLKAGCRMTTKVHNGKVYYGLAYQYEADAKIKARQNGNEVFSSSGRGNSGLLELGYSISTSRDKTSSIDFNAAGFAGQQQGFSVMAQFVKLF